MKALKQAIYTKFSETPNNVLYTALSGRLYFEEAPRETPYPYATYHIDTNTYDYTFTSEYEEFLVLFDMYSDKNSSSDIDDLFEHLKTVFDAVVLPITGYTLIRFIREFAILSRDSVHEIWQYTIQYRVYIRRD